MKRGFTVALLALTTTACGARSELIASGRVPISDAAIADVEASVAPTRPDCLAGGLASGTVRWRANAITGHPAVARDGTIYAPTVEPDGGRGLAAISPCGRVLWRAQGWVGTAAMRNVAQRPYARVVDDTDAPQVLLTNSAGANQRFGIFRYRSDSTALGMLSIDRTLSSFFGVRAGRGPLVLAWSGEGTRFELAEFSVEGARTTLASEFRNGEECAISGSILACVDRAFDLDARRALWDGPSDEIIDGTRRHVVGPAVVGDTLYAMLFGVRTYVLIAKEIRTGRERWRQTLASSSSGQTGYVGGAPVVASDGAVSVYLKLTGAPGALRSYTSEGRLRWQFSAPAGAMDFLHDATHAVASDGTHYLAVGATLTAVSSSGERLWSAPVSEGLSRGAPALSPFGDVYAVTDTNELIAVVANSAGEGASGWASSAGGARRRNAQ